MKQKFFTNTIQSNFIKALIYNTPIPLIKSINEDSYLLKDNLYIYKNNIIQCTASGMFKMPEIDASYKAYYRNGDIKIIPADTDSLENSDKYSDIYDKYTPLSQARYKKVSEYIFGKYYPKFTELYCSNNSYYDTTTHEYLGKLLRLYRDIYDINLMPYYNCISGDYLSGIVIYPSELKSENSKDYKIFKVPIKLNTSYTLALDCSNQVFVSPVFLNGTQVIENISQEGSNQGIGAINLTDEIIKNNIYQFNSFSFKMPQVIGVDTLKNQNATTLERYEKYLYLLIQVPKDNDSSVVLLEGDYTKVYTDNIYNIEGIDKLNDLQLSGIMTTNLSLLQFNDRTTYPYANRLIEYLLLNVITSNDKITKNVLRLQDLFIKYNNTVPEVWDNTLRSNIYLNYQKIGLARQLDLNGFVDRDTEELIRKFNQDYN